MARVITVTSGKGGVGKTTTAVNLGAAINSFGKDVIVVDASLTTPNVILHLGAPVIPISLHHVLAGKENLKDAIYEHHSGMKILPSSLSLANLKDVRPERLGDVVKRLKRMFDVVILDSSAGLGREAVNAISAADDILVVTNPELPALTDALKTIKLAERLDKNIKGVVLARVREDEDGLSLENVEEMLETPITEIIPEDESVKTSLRLRDAVVLTHPKSPSALAYKKLAAKLIGKKYKEETEKKKEKKIEKAKENFLFSILKKIAFI